MSVELWQSAERELDDLNSKISVLEDIIKSGSVTIRVYSNDDPWRNVAIIDTSIFQNVMELIDVELKETRDYRDGLQNIISDKTEELKGYFKSKLSCR